MTSRAILFCSRKKKITKSMVKEVHLGLIFNHQPSQAHHLCFLQDITQSSQNPGNSSRRKKYSSRYFRKSKTQLILPEPTRTLKSQTPSALQVGKLSFLLRCLQWGNHLSFPVCALSLPQSAPSMLCTPSCAWNWDGNILY